MKIAVIEDEKIVYKEVIDETLAGRKGAIVQVLGCGLCGSDIVKFKQKISKNGTVLGHEIVAKIVEIDSETCFKKGDRIITSHHIPCFKCEFCEDGHYSMCKHFKQTNIIPGGFSQLVFVSEEHLKNVAYLIPNTLTEIEASFYEPLGCCVRAVKRAKLKENSNVLVVGLGSVGLLMAQALGAFGMKVYGCELLPERINLAKKLGILEFDGNVKIDAVFLTAGADKTIELAVKSVKDGGKIVVFASTPLNMGFANNEIYYRELTVMGSYSPSPEDLKDSLSLLSEHKVVVNDFSTVYSFEKIEEAIDDTISNKILKAYIKISE